MDNNIVYDALVVVTPADFSRVKANRLRQIRNLPAEKVYFVGSNQVGELLAAECLSGMIPTERVEFICEDDILSFQKVHQVMAEVMAPLLCGRELPRGITGWYYQQFLKLEYARHCENQYYFIWDGDTIACAPFSMFSMETGKPYLDIKHEYHKAYFDTMSRLLPQLGKVIEGSFIAEHMLFDSDITKSFIRELENAAYLTGDSFWERILRSIPAELIQEGAFSEFETYGTYVALRYPEAYRLREWHSFRLAGEFFNPESICDRDYEWLSKDFMALSFEKGHTVREDHKNLFDNPMYQEKLSARQMVELAQETFTEGYCEIWDKSKAGDKNQKKLEEEAILRASECLQQNDSEGMLAAIRAGLAINNTCYELYVMLAEYFIVTTGNLVQAALCYEQAGIYCDNESDTIEIRKLLQETGIDLRPVSIVIASWNNADLMKGCVHSIRNTTDSSQREIIVVDNASTDGIQNWLAQQLDIKLVQNTVNVGFGKACNQGMEAASENNDIFFLNNDTIMTDNALFWLRIALAENAAGAVGCCTNYEGSHQAPIQLVNHEAPIADHINFAKQQNLPMKEWYEERNWLSGFALLIKREVLDRIGGFDSEYGMGYFEDNDLSERIRRDGNKLLLCRNSYIYHYGSMSFGKDYSAAQELLLRNRERFIQKWGYDPYE